MAAATRRDKAIKEGDDMWRRRRGVAFVQEHLVDRRAAQLFGGDLERRRHEVEVEIAIVRMVLAGKSGPIAWRDARAAAHQAQRAPRECLE